MKLQEGWNLNEFVKGSDMESCTLIGEYVDSRNGDYYEERYYFGRPFTNSDYVVTKRKYSPVKKVSESVEDSIPF